MKPIFATILLSIATSSVSHAVIDLDMLYDPDSDTTTAAWSGSWDNFATIGSSPFTGYSTYDSGGWALTNTYSTLVGGISFTSGDRLPTATWDSGSGDSVGFRDSVLYAPVSYIQGSDITASMAITGDVADVLLTGEKSGTYTGGGNTLNWTASAVPEPSLYALILGVLGIVAVMLRRNKR